MKARLWVSKVALANGSPPIMVLEQGEPPRAVRSASGPGWRLVEAKHAEAHGAPAAVFLEVDEIEMEEL